MVTHCLPYFLVLSFKNWAYLRFASWFWSYNAWGILKIFLYSRFGFRHFKHFCWSDSYEADASFVSRIPILLNFRLTGKIFGIISCFCFSWVSLNFAYGICKETILIKVILLILHLSFFSIVSKELVLQIVLRWTNYVRESYRMLLIPRHWSEWHFFCIWI